MYEDYHVGYIGFDLSEIPAGSTINSAELKLNMWYANSGAPMSDRWWIYRVTSWTGNFSFSGSNVANSSLDITGGYANHYANVTQLVKDMMGTGVHGFRIHANSIMYTTYIRGKDTGVNAPTLSIDYTPPNTNPYTPTVSISGYPTNNTWSNASSFTINWTFSDPNAGNTQSKYQVIGSTDRFNTWHTNTGEITNSGARSATVNITHDGTWEFLVRVCDQGGLWSDWGGWEFFVKVDRVNPYGGTTVTPTQYVNVAINGTYRITVTGVGDANSGVNRVQFPVWTDANGQDDLASNWQTNSQVSGVNAGGGTWYYDVPINLHSNAEGWYTCHIYVFDNAGNSISIGQNLTFVDRTAPANPNPTIANIKSTSVTVNWSAFNDASPSSGWLRTYLYLDSWNGSDWVRLVNDRDVGNVTTYNWTGLTASTTYRIAVLTWDNAGNLGGSGVWSSTFTTNTLPTTVISALSSSGYLVTQRPLFKITGTDANGSNVVQRLQVDNNSDFSSPVVDTVADTAGYGTGNSGWSIAGTQGSGTFNHFIPSFNIGTGTFYARVASWDVSAQEWGGWSSTYTFNVQNPSWATTVSAGDTTISKRTIDDLRTKVNAVRQARGLSAYSFTDASISDWNNGAPTQIRKVHLDELRTAVSQIYTQISVNPASWTDSTITANSTTRKGTHWIEIRNALTAY
jgi:hypothetical protein